MCLTDRELRIKTDVNIQKEEIKETLNVNQESIISAKVEEKSELTVGTTSPLQRVVPQKRNTVPVIKIISPLEGSEIEGDTATIQYEIKGYEAVRDIQVILNGSKLASSKDIILVPYETDTISLKSDDIFRGSIKLNISEPMNEIKLVALTDNDAFESDVLSLKRKSIAKIKDEFVIKPKLYVLSVGVSKYKNESFNLVFASKDAKDFVSTIMTQKGKLYRDIEYRLLTDELAVKDKILEGLEWIQRETTSKDLAIIFMSAHGINDPWGIYYFVPYNFDKQAIKRSALAFSDIKNTITSMAGKRILFIDTCHAGNVMGGGKAIDDMNRAIKDIMSVQEGLVVFASSTGKQLSWERPEWNNGAFTKAILEGINGYADYSGNGIVSINELDLYLSERVKAITQGQQTPTTSKPGTIEDFPIAVRSIPFNPKLSTEK